MKKFILTSILSLSTVLFVSAQVAAPTCVDLQNDLSYNNRNVQEQDPTLYAEVSALQKFLVAKRSATTGRSFLSPTALATGEGFFGRQTALAVWLYQFENKIVPTRFPKLLNQVTVKADTREVLACKVTATPRVEFIGNPTLSTQLVNNQPTLVGQAVVKITAGSVPVYTVNVPYIIDLNSVEGYQINYAYISRSAIRSVGDGESIPANSSAVFTITLSIPTAQLTSGQYTIYSTVANQPVPANPYYGNPVNLIGETGAGLVVTGDVQSGVTIATGDVPVVGDPIIVTGDPVAVVGDPITYPATEVGPTGAILNMLFDSLGKTYTTYFNWGTSTASLPNTVIATQPAAGSMNSATSYSAPILGLYPNTYYYFQANAKGADGVHPGAMLSFLTSPATGCPAGYGSVNGKCTLKPTVAFYVRSTISNGSNLQFATSTAGSPITLNWSATNAYTCQASNAWSGVKLLKGIGETYYPTGPTTVYTLTCMGDGGETSASVVVNTITPTTAPATQVLSPNGGEVFPFDTSMLIKWKPFTTTDDKVNVFVLGDKPSPYGTDAFCIIGTASASSGQFNWSPTRSLSYCNNMPTLTDGSKLKIQLRPFNIMGEDPRVIDNSDGFFSVGNVQPTAPGTPTTPPNTGGLSATCLPADLDKNGVVNMADLKYARDNNLGSSVILRERGLIPKCYVGPNYAYSIETTAGGQFTYTGGTEVAVTAVAFTSNGTMASSIGGYTVTGYISSKTTGAPITAFSMTYNPVTSTWGGTLPVPTTAGTYSVQVVLDCSVSTKCGALAPGANGVAVGSVTNQNSYTFVVNGPVTTTNVPVILGSNVTFVTGSSLTARYLPGNSTFQIGTFNIKTNNNLAGAILKDLTFTVPANTIASITVNGKVASVVGTTATIYDSNITVPANGVDLIVSITTICAETTQGCSGKSGSTLNVALSSITYHNGVTVAPKVVTTAISPNHILAVSKPEVFLAQSSTGTFGSGVNKIGEFYVTADAGGNIELKQIPVMITLAGGVSIVPGSVELRDKDGNNVITGTNPLSGTGNFIFSVPRLIGRGQAEIYSVYANISGVTGNVGSQSITFQLGNKSSFIWNDVSGQALGLNGNLINTYPASSQTITSATTPKMSAPLVITEQTPVQKINSAQFVSQNVPTTMVAGQTYSVSVTMKNTGNTTWTSAANYKLGSQNPQDNITWGGRIYLAAGESVAPNATKTFTFNVKAPTNVSSVNFQWKMVEELVQWFGDTSTNVAITVTQPVVATPAPTPIVTPVPTPATVNGVTVVSPNGGETYKAGSSMTVTWKTKAIDSSNNSIGLTIYDVSKGPAGSIVATTIANPVSGGVVADSGSYTFTIPAGTSGTFKIYMSSTMNWDESDGTFTITP